MLERLGRVTEIVVTSPSGKRTKYLLEGARLRTQEVSHGNAHPTFMIAGRLVEEIPEHEDEPDRMEGIGDG